MTPSLYAHTVALLIDRPRGVTLRKVADDTGLSYAWLAMIARDAELLRLEPSAVKIQKLYEYLAGRPLLPTASI